MSSSRDAASAAAAGPDTGKPGVPPAGGGPTHSGPAPTGLGSSHRRQWLSQGVEALFAQRPERGSLGASAEPLDIDVLIIGSGYGGAVAASRLAGQWVAADGTADGATCPAATLAARQPGSQACRQTPGAPLRPLNVVMLERGREYLAGAFPSRAADLPGHLRFTTPGGNAAKGRLEGLFDLRLGADMTVVLANGVGGGSLINAGVMELPDAAVYNEAGSWPADKPSHFDFTQRAEALRGRLGALKTEASDEGAALPRHAFMLKQGARAVPITVARQAGHSSAGVALSACIHCGDCATGCNHGAKDSLDLNLLASAWQQGLQLYAGATVSRIRRCTGGWEAEVWHTDAGLRKRMASGHWLRARRIILAAGALGSTEILLRSQTDELQFSGQLGKGFSGNGDVLATLYNAPAKIQAVANEDQPAGSRGVGPTITSMIDLRAGPKLVVQDLAVPGPLRRLFEEAATTSDLLQQLDQCDTTEHRPSGTAPDPMAVDPAKIQRSLALALIYRDEARGLMTAVPDDPHLPRDAGLRIDWRAARDDRRLQAAHTAAAQALGVPPPPRDSGLRPPPLQPDTARLLPNPMWQLLPPKVAALLSSEPGPLITVHPLGGCRMADGPAQGVVDASGRVFDPAPATASNASAAAAPALHDGLVVLDGAIVPCALGINPALTIATLADLALDRLVLDWQLVDASPVKPKASPDPPPLQRPRFRDLAQEAAAGPAPAEAVKTQVQVIERLAGWVDLPGPQDAGAALKPYWVELDLVYAPTALFPGAPGQGADGFTEQGHTLHVAADATLSRLRIFPDAGSRFDANRKDDGALLVAPLAAGSTLRFFHREASSFAQRRCRTLGAWWRNRGARDSWQALVDWATHTGPGHLNVKLRGWQALALASRGGEVRLFDYQLTLGAAQAKGAFASLDGKTGLQVTGSKRFSYTRRGNPWSQLMDLQLNHLAGLPLGAQRTVSVQPAYFAAKRMPLMRVVAQQDQPSALIDLLAFGAYLARVFLNVHVWSMRKPDPERPPRGARRLPAPPPGLAEPEVFQFRPDGAQDDAEIRLTAWREPLRPGQPRRARLPVLMIHGYSASGTTFAHPLLQPGLAAHLWQQGFEPWVVDLRTSSGMPSADRPYSFEDIALADIPAAIRKVCQISGHDQIDIVSHCMGSAMLAMTLQSSTPCGPQTAARIRRWVMSQFGPRLRFSPANMLRAYLISWFREALPDFRYSLKPGDDVPGVDGGLYDRFINTLPYLGQGPNSEFDVENPWWQFWRCSPWVGTRHRLDALIGRTFDARQMAPEVLAHIDDFFGPINLRTMSQPIFFAQMGEVAGSLGLDPFGRDAAPLLRGVPMLSLHGQRNGLADPETAGLLREWADGAGLQLEQRCFEAHGHQDLLIGRDCGKVFNDISLFLHGLPLPEPTDGGCNA